MAAIGQQSGRLWIVSPGLFRTWSQWVPRANESTGGQAENGRRDVSPEVEETCFAAGAILAGSSEASSSTPRAFGVSSVQSTYKVFNQSKKWTETPFLEALQAPCGPQSDLGGAFLRT